MSPPQPPPRQSPVELLCQLPAWREMIEDFRPLAESLEWRLADAHWLTNGVASFVNGSVPYIVNNDGRLSADAAAVLFANCLDQPPETGGISVLEVGAGTGLFARYFLDEFQMLCRAAERDFYQRLTYIITDRSPATVEFWSANGVFAGHAGHVRAQVADAALPGRATDGPLRAVFCNYILDTLASSTLRRSAADWEQLCVRTSIDDDAGRLRQYTTLGFDEMREHARSCNLTELLPLLPLLEGERAFLALPAGALPELNQLEIRGPGEVVAYNHGAVRFLENVVRQLEPGGFVLLNDYGSVLPQEAARFASGQWFGPASAMGLNFALMEHALRHKQGDAQILKPDGDDDLNLHSRLIHRDAPRACVRMFLDRFSAETSGQADALAGQARADAQSGNRNEAPRSFQAAIERNPRNWRLIGEAAEFASTQLRDHARAIELAQTALDLNPWYSPWLWNVCGEALAGAGRYDEAHECYLRAARIHPGDAATQIHLAESWLRRGSPERSLEAVAQGLAHDSDSMHRHVLLERQQAALAVLAIRWTRERETAARRQALPRV